MESSACKFWTKMKILSQVKKSPETTLSSSFAARIVNAIVVIPELQKEILFLIYEVIDYGSKLLIPNLRKRSFAPYIENPASLKILFNTLLSA